MGISYTAQVHFWRVAIWVLPIVIFFLTRPLVLIDSERGDDPPPDSEAPVGTVPGKES